MVISQLKKRRNWIKRRSCMAVLWAAFWGASAGVVLHSYLGFGIFSAAIVGIPIWIVVLYYRLPRGCQPRRPHLCFRRHRPRGHRPGHGCYNALSLRPRGGRYEHRRHPQRLRCHHDGQYHPLQQHRRLLTSIAPHDMGMTQVLRHALVHTILAC